MKQVAFRVGYDHVTNFINAFTAALARRRGDTPKAAAALREHCSNRGSADRRNARGAPYGVWGMPPTGAVAYC
jgi:hypothetical protein